jgi:hypothetical protein
MKVVLPFQFSFLFVASTLALHAQLPSPAQVQRDRLLHQRQAAAQAVVNASDAAAYAATVASVEGRPAQLAASFDAAWHFHTPPIDPVRHIGKDIVACNGSGWARFWGKITASGTNFLILQGAYECAPNFVPVTGPGGTVLSPQPIIVAYTNLAPNFAGTFILSNFPAGRLLPGDSFAKADAWWARVSPLAKISSTNVDRLGGVVHIGATNYHALDYGEVFTLSPEEKAAAIAAASAALDAKREALKANAVASDQKGADNGDQFAELEMGKRYRDGDGVPKDLDKAKEWFAKSAAQGNAQAARAFDMLNASKP